eukprot:5022805-Pleurochrysis_carterae.AAC.1
MFSIYDCRASLRLQRACRCWRQPRLHFFPFFPLCAAISLPPHRHYAHAHCLPSNSFKRERLELSHPREAIRAVFSCDKPCVSPAVYGERAPAHVSFESAG